MVIGEGVEGLWSFSGCRFFQCLVLSGLITHSSFYVDVFYSLAGSIRFY